MALTTLAKVKEYGPIETTADDDLLERLIGAASDAFEDYCSRRFASERRLEVRDGTGTRKLMAKHYPIKAIHSLRVDGQEIAPRVSPVTHGYSHSDISVRLTGYEFSEGVDNIELDYTAGLESVPGDLEQACIESVILCYRARDRLGVSGKSIAGESITFAIDDLPKHIVRVLDRYRMVMTP